MAAQHDSPSGYSAVMRRTHAPLGAVQYKRSGSPCAFTTHRRSTHSPLSTWTMKHIFRRRSKQPTVHWQQRDSSIPSARAAIRERTVMLLPSPSASGPAPAVATAGGAMHSPPRVSAPLPPSAREPASELSYVGERATQSAGRAHPAAAAYPHAEQHPDSATWPARAHMVFTSSRECSPPPFLPSESSGGPSDLPTDVGAPESLPFVVYRRHEEFWFEDGNVILVARGGVGFRVYKGVLCEAGTAWGPMFSRHDGPMHEGVPVIFLTDDPGNLTLVMRRLMPPQRMGAAPPSFLDITTLSACVRLGFKYGMDTLITHCRDFLLDLFPCDFDEWLDLEGRTFLRTLEERAEFLVPLVNLAHLLQYWYFVPAALLLACTVPEAQLVSGFDLPDGTTERLCAEDYARVAHLHSELRARLPVMLWELLDEFHPPSTCVKGPGECSASVKSPVVAHEIREWVLYCARNSAHPLPMWGWLSDVVYRQGVCRVCHAWLENEWKVKLKEVWLELPDILGLRAELPHWPEHADPEALTYSDADVSEDADRPISEGGQEGAGDSSRNPRDLDDRSFAGDHMAYGAQDAPADQSGIDSESGGEAAEDAPSYVRPASAPELGQQAPPYTEPDRPLHVIRKDDEFWYEDGNVILEAGGIHFRVYKGILYAASTNGHDPVFVEMLDGPLPPDTQLFQHVPIIKLTDDPEDLRLAFREIMTTRRPRDRESSVVPTFEQVAAWLRVSVKYDLYALVMKALHVLRTLFPPHFDAWYRSTTILDDHEKTQTIPWINLAQRFGAYPFLPAMFINCCALSEEELASGFRTADGATHYLPPEDLVRHRNLSRELCSSVPPALYRALEKFTSLCTEHPDTCSAGVAAAAQDIKATFFRAPGVPNDPFPRWGRYSKKMARHGVCAECEGLLENRWKEELGAIWSTLPQIMNLQLSGQQVLTGSVDSQLPDGVVS